MDSELPYYVANKRKNNDPRPSFGGVMQFALWSCSDTQRRRFTRRQLISAGILCDERRAPRFMIVAPAVITDRGDGEQKLGLVRDLSATGMFVYSSFRPQCGDALEIVVRLSNDSSHPVEIIGTGNVIRVEKAIAGAASGFAMEIAGYQLLSNGKLLLDADALARQLQQHARDAGTAAHTTA